jgi:hypothetical protein
MSRNVAKSTRKCRFNLALRLMHCSMQPNPVCYSNIPATFVAEFEEEWAAARTKI